MIQCPSLVVDILDWLGLKGFLFFAGFMLALLVSVVYPSYTLGHYFSASFFLNNIFHL